MLKPIMKNFYVRKMKNNINGWLCLDKPSGMSSNAALIKVRKIFGRVRVGYIGTLDPFATGVLPIAIGEARKFIPYVDEEKKTYIFTIIFGTETNSLDIDGNIIGVSEYIPSREELLKILPTFIGEHQQMPPKFSAIKINGRRACDLMRQGKENEIELNNRNIRIFSLNLISESLKKSKEATLDVTCSKGTYVRSLARDIAKKLHTVAYVKSLRRTKSSFFSINNAIPLEKLQKIEDTSMLMSFILPLESPLDGIPALYVSEDEARKLQNGLLISVGNSISECSNILIFEKFGNVFKGIGKTLSDGTVKAVRMCSAID